MFVVEKKERERRLWREGKKQSLLFLFNGRVKKKREEILQEGAARKKKRRVDFHILIRRIHLGTFFFIFIF